MCFTKSGKGLGMDLPQGLEMIKGDRSPDRQR